MASTRIAALSTAFAAGFAASHYSILTSWKIEAQRRDLDDERDFPGLPPTPTEPPYSDHARRILAYANPGPVADKLLRGGFLVAYDRRTRLPYYSAQLLPQPPPAEKIDRSKINFAEDGDIPPRFRSKVADYKGTGLDRGHLAPFADMPSVEAQKDSFLLSNIAPQDRGLNRGFWGDLEAWCRWLPGKGVDEVAVFTGPMFLSKKAEDGKSYVRYEVLGDPPNTAVPNAFFKVLLARTPKGLHVAAFMIPNESVGNDKNLFDFKVPIDAIENATGLVFPRGKDLCDRVLCDLAPFRKARARFVKGNNTNGKDTNDYRVDSQ